MRLRRGIDARHLVVGEIALFRAALLEGQAAEERIAEAHDRCAFELRRDPVGVYHHSTIHCEIDTRHRHRAILGHRHVRHRGDIRQETAMHGYAAPMTCRQRRSPAGTRGSQQYHVAHSADIDRILVQRCAVVGICGPQQVRIQLARLTEQRQ